MNYLFYDNSLKYPDDNDYYSPSIKYPEYKYNIISTGENRVYNSIRKIFIDCKLDSKNIGTSAWNPLGEFIKPGNIVLIKPNLVLHMNNRKGYEDDLDCLVTHPSIIRCVLDYVDLALKGTGTIYIGDSPVKDCNLHKLYRKYGYNKIQDFYSTTPNVKWVDLRGPEEERQEKCELSGIKVNVRDKSYFYNYPNQKGLRTPNYDYHKVMSHHNGDMQEYFVNELVLKADVVINLPKPKTHRKSGFTGNLKNFVGINYSKEYLPHHTIGDPNSIGDEYYKQTLLRRHASWIRSCRDIVRVKSNRHNKSAMVFLLRIYENALRKMDRLFNINNALLQVTEGTWYKNDTLWRTVLDLNNVVHYADRNGILQVNKQRTVIHLCDMVVSGEEEGPLAPSPKKQSMLLFGTNGVELDALLVKIMHFKISCLASIDMALKNHLLECADLQDIIINSNLGKYDGKHLINCKFAEFSPFVAAIGWKGYIEE